MTPNTKNKIKNTIHNLHTGSPIPNEDLIVTVTELIEVIEYFETINMRKYDLTTADLRNDLHTLQGYIDARKEDGSL
jgi:hypothetical protein